MLILLSFVEETLENIEQKLNEISGQAISVAGENFKAAIDLGISLGFLELRENEILLIYPPYILENLKKNVLVRIYENENDSSGNESNTSNHEEGLDGIEPDEAARRTRRSRGSGRRRRGSRSRNQSRSRVRSRSRRSRRRRG